MLVFHRLPKVETYAVLVSGDLEALAKRNKEAKQARARDRAAVVEWSRERFGSE
jgi:hypothetical protein